jgi:F-type H+-transporting ATPase subunit gamma
MPTLRDLRQKISAVKKTQQITKAMNMVSAAKLRGAQTRMEGFRPYAAAYAMMLGNMAGRIEPEIHPFFQQADPVERIGVVLMTGDRGLCGSFNVNLINAAEKFTKEKEAAGIQVEILCMGRKGRDFYRRRNRAMLFQQVDFWNKFDFTNAVAMAREITSAFLSGAVQEVYMFHATFVNVAIQRPKMVQLLPIVASEAADAAPTTEYIFEPPMEQFLEYLLPKYLNVQVYAGMLENNASEHAARMTAMDNATSNCKEMINTLTLVMNKARQAAITKELMDIVGGAEALKG